MVARIIGEIAENEFNLPEDFQDTAVRRFIVRTSKRSDGIRSVASAPGLPKRGHLHPSRYDMWCINVRGRQTEAWYKWLIECEYKLIPPNQRNDNGQGDLGKQQDPLKRDPDISGRFAEYQYVETAGSIADIQDNIVGAGGDGARAFTTSAGELYDPPPELTGYYILTQIKRNERFRDVKLWSRFIGAVNTGLVSGFAAGRVAIINIAWSPERWENNTKFVEVTYELGVKEHGDPWQLKLLDHGTYYLSDGEKVPFKDREGNPRLGLLNGAGGELGSGEAPKYRKFIVRSKKDFGPLKLPRFA